MGSNGPKMRLEGRAYYYNRASSLRRHRAWPVVIRPRMLAARHAVGLRLAQTFRENA